MKLNETIAKLRSGMGLSQEELAEALDISRQTVSKWETGQSSPDLEKFSQLCRVFSVSADDLLGLDSPTAPEAKNTAEPVIHAGLLRRYVTLGWVGVVISAVLLVCELIALYFIKNMEIEFAIARGAGYYPEITYYAAQFPMNLVFAVTVLLAVSGAALVVYGLHQQHKPTKKK